MEKDKDPIERNRPSDEGRKNDPNLRDESAFQPGVQTASSSDTDDSNQHLTKTASDHFDSDTRFKKNADPAFDDIDDERDKKKDK